MNSTFSGESFVGDLSSVEGNDALSGDSEAREGRLANEMEMV